MENSGVTLKRSHSEFSSYELTGMETNGTTNKDGDQLDDEKSLVQPETIEADYDDEEDDG